MRCNPDSVSTISLISPISSLKAASEKGFCIFPLEKNPRSPSLLYEEQSLFFRAISSKVSFLSRISFLISSNISLASDFDLVITDSLCEEGFLDLLCLIRIWEALTSSSFLFFSFPSSSCSLFFFLFLGFSQVLSFVFGLK